MPECTQAEQYLLEQIRLGSQEAWSQLVGRFEGRLTSFARRRLPAGADAEDLVQETFVRFLRSLKDFRGQSSVETYLFLILRRQIMDLFRRGKFTTRPCADNADSDPMFEAPAPDPTASGYARRDEQREAARAALTSALRSLVASLQQDLKFQDLQVLELVFYAQRPNRDIAEVLNVRPEQIAMIKHRWLKQVRERVLASQRQRVRGANDLAPDPQALDSLLTEIWENERLSCPKRSTIGGYVLKTLDEPWHAYVHFHVGDLGCPFCRANLDDLQKQTLDDPRSVRDRILKSTVGFFRKT